MGYRYLNVRINSVNDAFISCSSFVNFGPLTPVLTELNFVNVWYVRHGQKTDVFSRYLGIYLTNFCNVFTI